jgi:hypothetical protein
VSITTSLTFWVGYWSFGPRCAVFQPISRFTRFAITIMPYVYTLRSDWARTALCLTLATVLLPAFGGYAAIPAPEKLLPDDTLLVITAPDFAKLRTTWDKLPQRQLWNDPAMKPFRESFLSKWNEAFVKPLERELDIKCEDYTSLLQGQLTLAFTQNGWEGRQEHPPGVLLLLDTKDKSEQLKKNLAALRKKWADTGKQLKAHKIRDLDFTILTVSSNDIPNTLRKFFPKSSEVHELGDENASKTAGTTDELVLGQVESVLIISSSVQSVEKVVARITGGAVPPLADVAAYQADQAAQFRDSPLYGWLNLKTFIEVMTRNLGEKKENSEAPNPFDIKPEKVLGTIGLNGLKTLAFSFQQSNEGLMLQGSISVPESSRQGLFKILAGEPRESRPPPFVPGDAVKFQRWRIDGQKTWETLQKMINDISPQWMNGINFLIETANTAAQQKDPGFDFKKNLIGNLGDDMITYEKAPRGMSVAELRSPPSLFLLGSPNADSLAAALKSVLASATQSPGSPPEEREFLGRKIYSASPKAMMGPLGAGSGSAVPQTVSYAASGGYVAFSSDPALVEEYLRSSEGQRNSLREKAGLSEAAQKVTGPGSSLFGYENEVESTRAWLDALRKNPAPSGTSPAGAAANLVPSGLNLPATVQSFRELMDFSLLPAFDSIAKYFYFSVYGGSANVDGLSVKLFFPVPPGVKGS